MRDGFDFEAYGDPRRCPRHPNVATSSPNGMFDAPCGHCEMEMDMAAEADRAAAEGLDALPDPMPPVLDGLDKPICTLDEIAF